MKTKRITPAEQKAYEENLKKWMKERYHTEDPLAVIRFLLQEINGFIGVGSGRES